MSTSRTLPPRTLQTPYGLGVLIADFEHSGNVKLHPELLAKHQKHVCEKLGTGDSDPKPVFFVFHGGSGSSVDDFRTAIDNGVVKVNLDTGMTGLSLREIYT